jgi:dihydroneopterin aldolase
MISTRLGWIRLRDLCVDGVRIGIYPHEKDGRQSVVVDVGLYCDIGAASDSERIHETIDYDAIAATVRDFCRQRYYPLLESLCDKLAATLLERFPATRVEVEVAKPGALAPGTVSVQIERQR